MSRIVVETGCQFSPAGCESLEHHRITLGHVDIVMCAVLMAGRDDVLIERRPWQIVSAMRVCKDARASARSDLKSGVTKPLYGNAGASGCRQAKLGPLDNFELMTKGIDALRPNNYCDEQNEPVE